MNSMFSRVGGSAIRLSRPLTLTYTARHHFSITENLKNAITSGSIYRAIGIVASIHILGLVIGNKIFQKALTMSVVDYYQNTFVKENQQFQIAGVIKPGTFTVKRGTLETKFTITDFENDIEVFYRGATKFEFKEGETIILSAFLPDINNKKKIIGVDYLTKHSMDGTNWIDNVNISRGNFGVNTRTQAIT